MKLDLVKDLDAEEISKIWIQKHLHQEDSISAVVPAETYKKMLKRSKDYPLVRLLFPFFEHIIFLENILHCNAQAWDLSIVPPPNVLLLTNILVMHFTFFRFIAQHSSFCH